MLDPLLYTIGLLALLASILVLVYTLLEAPREGTAAASPKPQPPSEDSPLNYGERVSVLEGYDAEHAERIADLATRLGTEVGLDEHALEGLREAALLHDQGMEPMAAMLSLPRALSASERDQLPQHSLHGMELARARGDHPHSPWWVRWHHERVDGTGYPDGLMGDQIPLPAKILAIADSYEAMTQKRPYREALEPDLALEELKRLSGMAYDPELVQVFERVITG